MKITVASYLLERLQSMQISEIFGVPGDYNLGFLDEIVKYKGIEWVGTCNELNAAYAADGYARIRGIAAVVTTTGVGELSAINGIAGAYAEQVPIVNIVGEPARSTIQQKKIVHHSLGDGNLHVFKHMYTPITVAQTVLSPSNAIQEIDRVLKAAWLYKRPVYIGLPTDVVNATIDVESIAPLVLEYPTSHPDALQEAVERTACMLENAKHPIGIVDAGAARHHMTPLIQALFKKTGISFASTHMGKAILDESCEPYLGIYSGNLSSPGIQARVESSDCVIMFGPIFSDLNTGGFTEKLTEHHKIEVHPHYLQLQHARYHDLYFSDFIPALTQRLASIHDPAKEDKRIHPSLTPKNQPITQARFWNQISLFLQPSQIILAETGTSTFGTLSIPLPEGCSYINQVLWASIGYTVGALLGTTLAAPERESILFVGDGSFQLTAQEISTLIRQKKTPIIFLINNDGYTVERAIHGKNMPYNDIQMWEYSKLPHVFGKNAWTAKVSTETELATALEAINNKPHQLRLVEVMMKKEDLPPLLQAAAADLAKRNNYDNK